MRQVRSVGPSGSLIEADLGSASALIGRTVAQANWPRDVVLVSIARGDRVVIPRGDVVLEADDRLTIFTTPNGRQALSGLFTAPLEESDSPPDRPDRP